MDEPSGSLLFFGKKVPGSFSSYALDNPDLFCDVVMDIVIGA
jgi:hypothetical protein